ncbi:unnamed protein product [[Candida] boidinii]|nr:hypothetical protein BVG19_g916 [[Candida] boidinii]OWB48687.1 hypothetical protein B5S27_g222 [[Candida] boidinii]GME94087.1 unnamed protein product [[Candida] boidinii]
MSGFKSVQFLEKLGKILETNESLKKDSVSSTKATFLFNINNKSKESSIWYLDLKNDGSLKQLKSEDEIEATPDVRITVTDNDLRKLIIGKSNAQRLFMTGKLKVKGNVMKAANIEKILKVVRPEKSKL